MSKCMSGIQKPYRPGVSYGKSMPRPSASDARPDRPRCLRSGVSATSASIT